MEISALKDTDDTCIYTTEIRIELFCGREQAVGSVCVCLISQAILIVAKVGNSWASLIELTLKYNEAIYRFSLTLLCPNIISRKCI